MKLPNIPQEPTPKGKHSIRWNVYGNWVGYVSGRRFKEFGCQPWSEREAIAWRDGKDEEPTIHALGCVCEKCDPDGEYK